MSRWFVKKKNNNFNDLYASLYFNILYVQIRNYKDSIKSFLGALENMYEQCSIGYMTESINVDDILRHKLKTIALKFRHITENLSNTNEILDNILELYEGFGNSEVFEADTGKILSKDDEN